MTREEFIEILTDLTGRSDEEGWFEFKMNWYEADGIGMYISSLSNIAAMRGKNSAYLIWGVDNKTHKIKGTTLRYHRDVNNEPLEHYLVRHITPDINFAFYEETVKGKRVVMLEVPAARTVPTAFKGIRYYRLGSSRVSLAKYPEHEAALFRVLNFGLPTIENTAADIQELSFEQLFVYYSTKGITLNKRTFKKNLGLLTADGKYNMMAQLLSDDPHVPLRFSLFTGTTKGSPLYAIKEFGNLSLPVAVEQMLEYGKVLNVPQADERNRVAVRKEVMLFDMDAFREAVINAVLHNAWVTGNEPMFTVYHDRIEILSRGTLAPDQTMEGFYTGVSVPVNKKLSEIFLQLHISEKSGRGVPKIVEIYGKDAISFRENTITVTIPMNRLDLRGTPQVGTQVDTQVDAQVDAQVDVQVDAQVDAQDDVLFGVSEDERKILEYCVIPRTMNEITNHLGFKDRRSTKNRMMPLVEQGRIAMTVPDKPNSSKQKYIAIK